MYGPLREDTIAYYAYQILEGLKYLVCRCSRSRHSHLSLT